MRRENFYYEQQGLYNYLTYRVGKEEQVDQIAVGMINNNDIASVLKFVYTQIDDRVFVQYNVSSLVKAKQYLSGNVTRAMLLGFFSDILDAIQASEEYMFNTASLIFDTDYIFVDPRTKKAKMICVPVDSEGERPDLKSFFKNILFSVRIDQSESNDYVIKIMNYFNSVQNLYPADFKNIISSLLNRNSSAGSPRSQTEGPVRVQGDTSENDSAYYYSSGSQGNARRDNNMNISASPAGGGRQAGNTPPEFYANMPGGGYGNSDMSGMNSGMGSGMNSGMNLGMGHGMNSGINSGMNQNSRNNGGDAKGKASSHAKDSRRNQNVMPQDMRQNMSASPSQNMTPDTRSGTYRDMDLKPENSPSQPPDSDGEEISLFYLLQHYNKTNAAAYKAQKERKKANKVSQRENNGNSISESFGNSLGQPLYRERDVMANMRQDQPSPGGFAGGSLINVRDLQNAPGKTGRGSQAGMSGSAFQSMSTEQNQGGFNSGNNITQNSVQGFNRNTDSSRNAAGSQRLSAQDSQPTYTPEPLGRGEVDFGDTVALNAEHELSDTVPLGSVVANIRPYLVRIKTNEKVIIDKPEFRIGRDSSQVDYCVEGNVAVGRYHAKIILKDSKYYLVDNGSKNHTYVNGELSAQGAETPVVHGTAIRLADEEFEFRIF